MLNRLLLWCFMVLVAAGCQSYTVLSPAQLTAKGTHRYGGNASREQVTGACTTALTTLGYKVTVSEPASGIVKTAPSSIMTSATGGAGYANVTDDGLAWSIVVESAGESIIVHATPRAFRNGTEIHEKGIWVAEVMDAKFADLWRELDETLRAKAVAAPPRPVAAR
ncbi:MAG: hypothetical protein JWO86_8353 [Myxococcaceae bacterium]|nr:hypothetical protein [Myxococcaceae bacterium]